MFAVTSSRLALTRVPSRLIHHVLYSDTCHVRTIRHFMVVEAKASLWVIIYIILVHQGLVMRVSHNLAQSLATPFHPCSFIGDVHEAL